MADPRAFRRHWRFYKTPAGNSPVGDFLRAQTKEDYVEIIAAMNHVANEGRAAARHLRQSIYEVRVDGKNQSFRVLFSAEGRYQQVLLAVEAFSKKTQKTPKRSLELALLRLSDWRARGRER